MLVRVSHDLVADFGGAGEGDLVDIGVLSESLTSGGAVPGKKVNNTFGETSFHDEFSDAEGGQRGLLSWLHDNCATGGEGRSEFPGHHEGGEVPGDDLSGNTNGLLFSIAEVRSANGDGLTLYLVCPAGIVTESLDNKVNIGGLGESEWLTVVESLKSGDFIEVLLDEISKFVHQTTALGSSHSSPWPIIKCLAGSLDSLVDIFNTSLLHGSDLLLSGGVEGIEGLSCGGVHEFTVDQELSDTGLNGGIAKASLSYL